MIVQDKIIERLDKAISAGSAVVNSPGFNRYYADQGLYFAFKAHGLACLVDVLGANHSYTKSFEKMFVEDGRRSEAEGGQRLLQTVREEFQAGYLHSVKELINAEVFSDFIEMAEYLLTQGYKDPAAVLGGAVLEEHLRKLCDKNEIPLTTLDNKGDTRKKQANVLNDDLAKAGVYTKVQQKAVTGWQGIRNEAAHGNFQAYSSEEVRLMLSGITAFVATLPA
ncbi:hypothetical protein KBF38_22760 [bacterium]|nr:hypothetical protein [bacterium]